MRSTLQKIDDGFCTVCSWMISAAILALILLNFTQLVTRYLISFTFTWAEEVSTLAVIYAAAFGAPWVTLKRRHLRNDSATRILPEKVKYAMHWVIHGLIFVTGILYVVIGLKTVQYNTGFAVSILQFDESIRYLPLPIEGALIATAELITFCEDVLDAKAGKLVIK